MLTAVVMLAGLALALTALLLAAARVAPDAGGGAATSAASHLAPSTPSHW
jgi:hypothetical protein